MNSRHRGFARDGARLKSRLGAESEICARSDGDRGGRRRRVGAAARAAARHAARRGATRADRRPAPPRPSRAADRRGCRARGWPARARRATHGRHGAAGRAVVRDELRGERAVQARAGARSARPARAHARPAARRFRLRRAAALRRKGREVRRHPLGRAAARHGDAGRGVHRRLRHTQRVLSRHAQLAGERPRARVRPRAHPGAISARSRRR